MYRLLVSLLGSAALAGCASFAPSAPSSPAPGEPAVSIVNVMSWNHALSGKRDGLRSSWPLHQLAGHTEPFPLAQVKQCEGQACSWGVLKASRTVRGAKADAAGVTLDLAVDVSVARSQAQQIGAQQAAVAIPTDVAALSATRRVERQLVLPWGQVTHLDFDFGIAYDICAERLDGADQPRDRCPLPYF